LIINQFSDPDQCFKVRRLKPISFSYSYSYSYLG